MAAEAEIRDGNERETKLLLEAFEMFTQASSSLESVFGELQARAERLTEELESKNRELEKSLAEKEEAQNYLRSILERLPCGVLVLDASGAVALCNPVASEVLERSRRGGRRLGAAMGRHLAKSVSEKCTDLEIPFRGRTLATSGAPLTDPSGNPSGTLHIIRDITEVKQLQEQGKRMERLSAMGEMAVELAHEIRNPLAGIELFASLLGRELPEDQRRWAENIRVGIKSLNNIVSNMLHFANPPAPLFAPMNLHDAVEEILGFTAPIMSQRQVAVIRKLDAGDPVMQADRDQIRQMLLNLVLNAMNAMPSRGSLTVRTLNPDGSRLQLEIRDTGVGIPPRNLRRIFDPFFTTNKNGTGLGLSVVHQIVKRHGGSIGVSSAANCGTAFTLVFPAARQG